MMVVAGSLPPWVMQLGRNRKKIILPPKNTSKNLISIVGYVLAEEKIFLLPEGYLSHCPILSLPCRPNMQCFISCPCAQTTASRIQPHLLKHSFCQMSPMHTRADWDIPAGACLSEIPFCSSTGPQTAKVLFAWKKKKKATPPPPEKQHTHKKKISEGIQLLLGKLPVIEWPAASPILHSAGMSLALADASHLTHPQSKHFQLAPLPCFSEEPIHASLKKFYYIHFFFPLIFFWCREPPGNSCRLRGFLLQIK